MKLIRNIFYFCPRLKRKMRDHVHSRAVAPPRPPPPVFRRRRPCSNENHPVVRRKLPVHDVRGAPPLPRPPDPVILSGDPRRPPQPLPRPRVIRKAHSTSGSVPSKVSTSATTPVFARESSHSGFALKLHRVLSSPASLHASAVSGTVQSSKCYMSGMI